MCVMQPSGVQMGKYTMRFATFKMVTYHVCWESICNWLWIALRHTNAHECTSEPQEVQSLCISSVGCRANNDSRGPQPASDFLDLLDKTLIIKFSNVKEYFCSALFHK